MNTIPRIAAAALLTAAVAAPLSIASPASATTIQDGCSFTALKPTYAGTDSDGDRWYRFTVKAACAPGRTVGMRSEAWEQDKGPNDRLGSWHGTWKNWRSGETRKWSHTVRIPWDEPGEGMYRVELYHRVHFKVRSNGVTGELSRWDYSSVVKADVLDIAARG